MKHLYYISKYTAGIITSATFTKTLTEKTVSGVETAVAAQFGGGTIGTTIAKVAAASVYGDVQRTCYNKLWNMGWYAPDALLSLKELCINRDVAGLTSTAGYVGGALGECYGYTINKGIAYATSTAVGFVCPVLAAPTYYATHVAVEYAGVGRIAGNYVGYYTAKYASHATINTVNYILGKDKVQEEKPAILSLSQIDNSQMGYTK